MFKFSGVVVIDDDKNELKDIQDALFGIGLPCLPIHFQEDDIENSTGIDHVDTVHINPKIIITDLYLRSLLKTPETIAPVILEIIKKLVKKGPYILYFWSKREKEVKNVMLRMEEMSKDEAYEDVQLPLDWGCIEKSKFRLSSSNTENNEKVVENQKNLRLKIEEILRDSLLFHSLFDWESRVAQAASDTTAELCNLAYPDPNNLESDKSFQNVYQQNIQNLLANIANESIGVKNAKISPSLAIESGLAPVLTDQLHASFSSNETTVPSQWHDAVPDIGKHISIPEEYKAALNTFYHIEEVDDNYPKSCRGVFVELNPDIQVDDAKFLSRIGVKESETLNDIKRVEFFENARNLNRLEKTEIMETIKLGFIEISAECDQAQQKIKLHRYALAAIYPLKQNAFKLLKPVDKRNKDEKKRYGLESHAGIYRLPECMIGGVPHLIQVSFKYQFGISPNEHKWLGLPKFRLKEQVMTDLSFRLAKYISRPGIVSF